MSNLVLLGGPTGVGKSTALKLIENRLPKLALLDADDVWRISEDLAANGTRETAISNVVAVLQGYLRIGCETAILSWVFARPPLYEPIITKLTGTFDEIHQLYLVASPKAIRTRLEKRGDLHRLEYSISRLERIQQLPFTKLDTTHLSATEVSDRLCAYVRAL